MIKPLTLAKNVVKLCESKKGENIKILDVTKISNFCDFFVIVTGNVEQHINSLAEYIVSQIKDSYGLKPLHIEGKEYLRWIVIDYGNVIVHIMNPALREFYALEKIWSKGKVINYETKHKKRSK